MCHVVTAVKRHPWLTAHTTLHASTSNYMTVFVSRDFELTELHDFVNRYQFKLHKPFGNISRSFQIVTLGLILAPPWLVRLPYSLENVLAIMCRVGS
jgi:hypothetical protein